MPLPNDKFVEVEVIRDAVEHDIAAVVTQKVANERFSFALVKEYRNKAGESCRTGFFGLEQIAAVKRLLTRVEKWLESEEAKVHEARAARIRRGA